MSKFAAIEREAGSVTRDAILKMGLEIEELRRDISQVISNNQFILNLGSLGLTIYFQSTEPPVPAGLGIWENTSTNPHKHFVAHTNSTGTRVWRVNN